MASIMKDLKVIATSTVLEFTSIILNFHKTVVNTQY